MMTIKLDFKPTRMAQLQVQDVLFVVAHGLATLLGVVLVLATAANQ